MTFFWKKNKQAGIDTECTNRPVAAGCRKETAPGGTGNLAERKRDQRNDAAYGEDNTVRISTLFKILKR